MDERPPKDLIEPGKTVTIETIGGTRVLGKFIQQYYDLNGNVKTGIYLGSSKNYKKVEVGFLVKPKPPLR